MSFNSSKVCLVQQRRLFRILSLLTDLDITFELMTTKSTGYNELKALFLNVLDRNDKDMMEHLPREFGGFSIELRPRHICSIE